MDAVKFFWTILPANRIRRFASSTEGASFAIGLFAAFHVITWLSQIVGQFGTSLRASTSIAVAVALGIQLGSRGGVAKCLPGLSNSTRFGVVCFLISAWSVSLPWMLDGVFAVMGFVEADRLSEGAIALLLMLGGACCLLSFPMALIASLPAGLSRLSLRSRPLSDSGPLEQRHPSKSSRWFLTGLATGILLLVLLMAPVFGVWPATVIAVVAGSVLFLNSLRLQLSVSSHESGDVADQPASLKHTTEIVPLPNWSGRTFEVVWKVFVVTCLGIATSLIFRVTDQLMPSSSFVVYSEWAFLLWGLAAGLWVFDFAVSRRIDTVAAALAVCALLAIWCIAVVSLFSVLVSMCLTLNSSVQHQWALMLIRSGLAGFLVLPIGVAYSLVVSATNYGKVHNTAENGFPPVGIAALGHYSTVFVGGMLIARWWAISLAGVAGSLVFVAWSLAVLWVVGWVHRRSFQAGRLQWVAAVGVIALLITGSVFRENYAPELSARLLFNSNVLVANQADVDSELLEHLDEARNIATAEGNQGTYTVWRYRGAQLQVRESGVPKAAVSRDPAICPEFSAEILQSVIPLVLHEKPHRIMVLGLGGGVPLKTSLSFPLQELTCLESDPHLIKLLKQQVWSVGRENADSVKLAELVRFTICEPAIAIACQDDPYDVIISSPDQSALMQAVPYFTREFYERASHRLASEGIFCQRLQHVDYGPQPLRSVLATILAVFKDVVLLETAPGESLLLATNSPRGLARDGFERRLKAEHVRNILSHLGWDWTVPLNLTAYNRESLETFCASGQANINTTINARLAFQLPLELMRWGDKWQEKQTALSIRQGRFLEWCRLGHSEPDVLARMSEVAGQRNLMTNFPDQFWEYRKTLRKQMSQRRSRSPIQQVKAEFSEDAYSQSEKHRIAYFTTLGRAAKDPTLEKIRRVANLESPFDPLVSYFLHHEVAEMYHRIGSPDVRAELSHRLHSVYYANPADRSIRNVTAAIDLLVQHPNAIPNAADRYDHLNALLQVLKMRWNNRGTTQPGPSRIVLNDIEMSVSAIEGAFAEMQQTSRESDALAEDWNGRRAYLEKALTRPLRTYRSQLLKHHLKQKRRTNELFESR